jgi:Restriction endonuclease
LAGRIALLFMGTLYYGDNLDILKRYIKDEAVDLVYLDPPFNSAQNYAAFFQEKDGTASASQIRAFEDTWTWNQESQRVYEELILQPGKVSEVMQAFRTFLGTNDTYGGKLEIITVGEPTTPNEAATLAEEDKYQFQWWALGLVGARPVEQKKGADHGIDGKILFRDDLNNATPEQIIIQVKGGKTGVKDVRDLRGVLDREKAAIGVLISLQESTGPMDVEAASVGFYEHKTNKQKFPRLQLRTVKELMEGKGIQRPTSAAASDETFKKAPASKKKDADQTELDV